VTASNDKFRAMLIRHEGMRLRAYRDSEGVWTIGIGRNIETRGLTEEEVYYLFDNDVLTHTIEAQKLPVFDKLDPVRQDVLISMVFNMGLPRLLGFRKFLGALEERDWPGASREMLDSRWSSQVGNRAQELAKMIRTGAYE